MSRDILVVGGAGYIGSHMVRMLADAGHRVTVFDNLCRGHRDAVGDARFIEGDIRSSGDLQRGFASGRFDVVMHFAAFAYVGESTQQPALYYDNNVTGSLRLLEAMREAGVNRLVFSSTCATYGDPVELPITESHPQRPVNPYGATKMMVEHALRDYGRAYGFDSIALRYFNAAGCDPQGRVGERHFPETHLIPLALEEALRVSTGGDPASTGLSIYGNDFDTVDGTCVRDYIHVDDLCRAHLLAADRLLSGACRGAETYNLGNGRGFSVLEVIAAVRRVTGVDIRYRMGPRRVGDPGGLVGSAVSAGEVLGWQPRIPGIDEMVATAWRWMLANPTRGAHVGNGVASMPAP
ncbi:UDP-glucose 4-epimerase GalE [Cognatilysobacter lacus]|uniref:UDP-glucose 4-epimerase n=1 Tax=Cognatilysobacter lacus TaxID=1643323 RepID=A0A5D8Z8G3_9GAMM|nr:UDP-glucose 4-epimerase GalE [Lysobacter lacus]TZF91198.1 UDP-glucose 4-epimerase GalE [Lysobacter lacus]